MLVYASASNPPESALLSPNRSWIPGAPASDLQKLASMCFAGHSAAPLRKGASLVLSILPLRHKSEAVLPVHGAYGVPVKAIVIRDSVYVPPMALDRRAQIDPAAADRLEESSECVGRQLNGIGVVPA